MGRHGLDLSGVGWGQVMDSCEYRQEHLGFNKLWGMFWLTEKPLYSCEGFCCMDLVI
jgi:hypothetical protein